MDEKAKRRLIGAAVLVAMMVIFVPMLVGHREAPEFGEPIVIPPPPDVASRIGSSVEPTPDDFSVPLPAAEEASVSSAVEDLRPGVVVRQSPEADGAATPPSMRLITQPTSKPPASTAQTSDRPPARPAQPTAMTGPVKVPDGVQSWVIQVGSFSEPNAATTLQGQLRQKGYPAFIEQAVVTGVTYYRVRVGPEVDRGRAEKIAVSISGEFGGSPLVQLYR